MLCHITLSNAVHMITTTIAVVFLSRPQMSLDVKRAEIRNLEERARQREEALKKSEVH
jgi:hypothetical protein